jgi:hypothetical protein
VFQRLRAGSETSSNDSSHYCLVTLVAERGSSGWGAVVYVCVALGSSAIATCVEFTPVDSAGKA